jgi:hypothetical protein
MTGGRAEFRPQTGFYAQNMQKIITSRALDRNRAYWLFFMVNFFFLPGQSAEIGKPEQVNYLLLILVRNTWLCNVSLL